MKLWINVSKVGLDPSLLAIVRIASLLLILLMRRVENQEPLIHLEVIQFAEVRLELAQQTL